MGITIRLSALAIASFAAVSNDDKLVERPRD